jgi:mRNA interferase RelE/StbE
MCRVVTSKKFNRCFKKLDQPVQQMLQKWVAEHLATSSNPRAEGRNLCGNFKGFWRYRVGNYRLISSIDDRTGTVFMLDLGHRSTVYA